MKITAISSSSSFHANSHVADILTVIFHYKRSQGLTQLQSHVSNVEGVKVLVLAVNILEIMIRSTEDKSMGLEVGGAEGALDGMTKYKKCE